MIKLTLNKVAELHAALLALSGRQVIVRGDSKDSTVTQPYNLGPKARWNIRKNVRILKEHLDDLEDDRKEQVKEFSGGGDTVPPEKHQEFFRALQALRDQEVELDGVLLIPVEEIDSEAYKNSLPFEIMDVLHPVLSEAAPVPA